VLGVDPHASFQADSSLRFQVLPPNDESGPRPELEACTTLPAITRPNYWSNSVSRIGAVTTSARLRDNEVPPLITSEGSQHRKRAWSHSRQLVGPFVFEVAQRGLESESGVSKTSSSLPS